MAMQALCLGTLERPQPGHRSAALGDIAPVHVSQDGEDLAQATMDAAIGVNPDHRPGDGQVRREDQAHGVSAKDAFVGGRSLGRAQAGGADLVMAEATEAVEDAKRIRPGTSIGPP